MLDSGYPAMIITALFWLWSLPSLPGVRFKLAKLHGLTHLAFSVALALQIWPWVSLAPWTKAAVGIFCAIAFVAHAILTTAGTEDFWAKRRNRLVGSLAMIPVAACLAVWCDPPHAGLLFAAAVYAGVRSRRARTLSERQADTQAMREKILTLTARVHNQELTDRVA